ncbi:MAG: flavin reductase family protein [Rhodobacterales bacterium]|nr:flavin reductase family protein [Rhodobacterales bacterium]
MFYDPRTEPHGLAHNPWLSLVMPRPIGWISTLSPDGVANLAPYSYFNAVSGFPPFVMFSSAGRKDSQTNVEATGEFVANMAGADLKDAMNQSAATVGPEVDEFELTGLEKAPCRNVSVPRVAAAPVALECVLNQVVPMVARDGTKARSEIIIGEVVGIHIADSVIVDGMLDIKRIRPLGRLGYMDYVIVEDVIQMMRPGT